MNGDRGDGADDPDEVSKRRRALTSGRIQAPVLSPSSFATYPSAGGVGGRGPEPRWQN
ncbi:hypothetical protein FALBO_17462, partial [Fusarium albosuccineum]